MKNAFKNEFYIKPPNDEEIKQILSKFNSCQFCKIKLSDNNAYYFEKTKEDNVVCDVCYSKLDFKSRKNYTLVSIFLN